MTLYHSESTQGADVIGRGLPAEDIRLIEGNRTVTQQREWQKGTIDALLNAGEVMGKQWA